MNKAAFTLLETLIVLGLVVTVISAGAFSLTSARNSIELDNTYSDVISAIRTTQNNARNYISIELNGGTEIPPVPDIYGFRIDTDAAQFIDYACTQAGSNVTCNIANRTSITSSISDIDISSSCYIVGFRKGMRDIVSISQGGTVNNSGTCAIGITQGNDRRDISINLNENNISLN